MNRIFRVSPFRSLPLFAVILLAGLVILAIPLLVLGLVGAAFSRLGFSWVEAVAVILLMVLGSFVNIPLWTFRRIKGQTGPDMATVIDAFTGEPVPDGRLTTTLSLNLGGAVIPFAVSIYLLYQVQWLAGEPLLLKAGIAILIVALITGVLTKAIPLYGIRAPLLVPAVSAIATGIILGGGTGLSAATIAFVGGTTGTLVGASISILQVIKKPDVHSISIGGTGTFGAVFLCGLLAALIA